MGKYRIKIEEEAKKDLQKINKSGNTSSIKKSEKIILELSEHPTLGIGNPEALKHSLSGYWS
jgi:toxin YoeB